MRRYDRSNEPIVWSLFGAGGMVAAFLLPVVVLSFGILLPLGVLPTEILSYERISNFSNHWLGKALWIIIIALPCWHAVHRIYHALHDFKVGYRKLFFWLCYGFAMLLSISALVILVK